MIQSLRQSRFLRCSAVFVVLLAWLVVSNRCGLAMFAQAQKSAKIHACCGGPSAEHKAPVQKDMLCCHALTVAMPESATTVVQPIFAPVLELLAITEIALVLPKNESVQQLDTGPPDEASTFVELVLHRSLLAHAPPVFC